MVGGDPLNTPGRAIFGIETIADPALVIDSRGAVTELNRLAATLLGRSSGELPLATRDLTDSPELSRWLTGGRADPLRMRTEVRRADGVPITVELRAAASGEGNSVCLLRELPSDRFGGEAQRYFDHAFERSPIGMALFDTAGRYTRVNDSLCRLLGRSREDLLGRRDQELTHPDDRQADVDLAWRVLRGEDDTAYLHKRLLRADGEIVWVIVSMSFLRDEAGNALSWVGQFVDITEAKQLEADLRRLAELDSLTGLANRRAIERRLNTALAEGRHGALLLIDVDGFKAINDAGGHPLGDRVLIAVARAIAASLRRTDTAARWGGDEFAVLIDAPDPRSVERVGEGIAARIGALTLTSEPITVSIGSAGFGPDVATDALTLHATADAAMYRRKGERRVRAGGASG